MWEDVVWRGTTSLAKGILPCWGAYGGRPARRWFGILGLICGVGVSSIGFAAVVITAVM